LTVSSLPSLQTSIGLPGVVVAIIFIGAGTGGIKANVSTFVADQIRNADELTTERVFRLFYLCINIGSFGGILLTPILHAQLSGGNGYWASFGLPALMMLVALLIFVSGRARYVRQPLSRENALIKGIKMMRTAADNKRANVREGVLMERKEHWLDWAVPPYSATFVQGYKDFFKILAVFIPLPVYWALYNQQTNTWISQATEMNLQLSSSFSVTADQTQIIDPIVIVIFIPVVDQWLLPMLRKRGFPLKPITRMVIGLVIAASAFVAAALLQMTIDKSEPHSVSVAYQVPQYSLIAMSEIFTSVTGLEIAYSQAPDFLKATVMAFYQLAVAGGAVIVIVISQGLASTPMFVQFWIYFGMMTVFTLIFYLSFRRFKYREGNAHDRAE
jgi:dipeptide/tripeptide permease